MGIQKHEEYSVEVITTKAIPLQTLFTHAPGTRAVYRVESVAKHQKKVAEYAKRYNAVVKCETVYSTLEDGTEKRYSAVIVVESSKPKPEKGATS